MIGLYGGVVPYPFVKTKVITHDLVSNASARPDGWSCSFARATRDVVVPGYTVFSVEDAWNAAKRLLRLGALRVKEPLGAGGYGQSIITTYNELAQFIEIYSTEKVATCGLVLETNLRPVLTRSVGQITIGGAMLAYYGTQRTVINNRGQAVYGGSDIICVRGGWDALERLPKDPEAQLAVAQARTYDLAAGKYPAFSLLAETTMLDRASMGRAVGDPGFLKPLGAPEALVQPSCQRCLLLHAILRCRLSKPLP